MPDWTPEGYQKILKAGERGRQSLIEAAKLEYERKVNEYNKCPKYCKNCQVQLSFDKYIKKAIYCSRSCAAKVNNSKRKKKKKKKGELFICLNCNKKYEAKLSNIGKYCSLTCSHVHKKELKIQSWLKGEHTPCPSALRNYLKHLRPHQCEICSLSSWNSLPIPLEMDHIDGDHKNNHPSNLRLLCPNCHAQTPTYKSKNRGRGRESRRERWRLGKTC